MTLLAVVQKFKQLVPPIFVEYYKQFLRSGITFRGEFRSWTDAECSAEGYDAEQILQKVRTATIKVVQGRAACERDSVLFPNPVFPFPLIAVLLRAAQENQGNLKVLDVGGALGSSYYQCRDFLRGIGTLHWCVVEQPQFVACGRREFQDDILRFYENVEGCLSDARPHVVLLSGVLQYLSEPIRILEQLAQIGAAFIVIDRTPIASCGKQVISVQHVPAAIYSSSYPVWLFNEEQLKAPLRSAYEELAAFDAVDGELGQGRLKALFKGFIFRRTDGGAEG